MPRFVPSQTLHAVRVRKLRALNTAIFNHHALLNQHRQAYLNTLDEALQEECARVFKSIRSLEALRDQLLSQPLFSFGDIASTWLEVSNTFSVHHVPRLVLPLAEENKYAALDPSGPSWSLPLVLSGRHLPGRPMSGVVPNPPMSEVITNLRPHVSRAVLKRPLSADEEFHAEIRKQRRMNALLPTIPQLREFHCWARTDSNATLVPSKVASTVHQIQLFKMNRMIHTHNAHVHRLEVHTQDAIHRIENHPEALSPSDIRYIVNRLTNILLQDKPLSCLRGDGEVFKPQGLLDSLPTKFSHEVIFTDELVDKMREIIPSKVVHMLEISPDLLSALSGLQNVKVDHSMDLSKMFSASASTDGQDKQKHVRSISLLVALFISLLVAYKFNSLKLASFAAAIWFVSDYFSDCTDSLTKGLFTRIMKYFGDEEFKPQGGDLPEVLDSILKLLLGVLAMKNAVSWDFYNSAAITKMVTSIASIGKAKEGLSEVLTWAYESITIIVNFVRTEFLGMDKLDWLKTNIPDVDRWCNEVEALAQHAFAGTLPLNLDGATRVSHLHIAGLKFQRIYNAREFARIRSAVEGHMKVIQKLLITYQNANLFANSVRTEPLIILFRGAPGVGKTYATQMLATQVMARYFQKHNQPSLIALQNNHSQFFYPRNAEQQYWDGYAGQFTTMFDDFGQAKSVAGNPDDEYMNLIRCAGIFGYPLHVANLEEKGRMHFTSKMVIATTNLEHFKPASLMCPEALERRFDFVLEFYPKEEFSIPGAASGVENRRLNRAMLGNNFRCDIYEISRHVFVAPGKTERRETMTWEELVDACVARLENNVTKAETYLEEIKRIATAEYKPQGLFKEALKMTHIRTCPKDDVPDEEETKPIPMGQLSDFETPSVKKLSPSFFDVDDNFFECETDISEYKALKCDIVDWIPIYRAFNFNEPVDPFDFVRALREKQPKIYDAATSGTKTDFTNAMVKLSKCREGDEILKRARHLTMNLSTHDFDLMRTCKSLIFDFKEWVKEKAQWIQSKFLQAYMFVTVWWQYLDMQVKIVIAMVSIPVIATWLTGLLGMRGRPAKYTSPEEKEKRRKAQEDAIAEKRKHYERLAAENQLKMGKLAQKHLQPFSTAPIPLPKISEEFESEYKGKKAKKLGKRARRTANIKDKLDARYGSGEDFSAEGIVDENAMQIIARIIKRNLFTLRSDPEIQDRPYAAGKVKFGHVLAVGGHVIMFPMHFMKSIERRLADKSIDEDYKFHLVPASSPLDDLTKAYVVTARELLTYKTTETTRSQDIVAVELPNTLPMFPSITKYFVEHDSICKMELQDSRRVCLLMPNLMGGHVEKWADADFVDHLKVNGEESEIGRYVIDRTLIYEIPTTTGDCGSVLVNSGSLPSSGRILGLHVAGSQIGNGVASVISREDVEELISLFFRGRVGAIPTSSGPLDGEHFAPQGDQIPHRGPQSERRGGRASYDPQGGDRENKDTEDLLENAGFAPASLMEFSDGVFPLTGTNFVFYGISQKAIFGPPTSLRKSDLFGAWGVATTAPAVLRPVTRDGVLIDPLHRAVSTYGAFKSPHHLDLLTLAVDFRFATLHDLKRRSGHVPRVFDFETAVLGVVGDPFLNAIPRNTSAGYPHCLRPVPGYPGKSWYFGTGDDYDLTRPGCLALQADVERIVEDAKRGVRHLHIYVDTLKDERRKLKKIEDVKTRLVSASPLPLTIAIRMFFLDFIAFMMRQRIVSNSAIGVDVHSEDWDRAARALQQKGPHVIAGDYSGFDTCHSTPDIKAFIRNVNRWYDDEFSLVRETLGAEMWNSIHIMRDVIYGWNGPEPSGTPPTTCMNGEINMYKIIQAYMLCHPLKEAGLPEFSKHVYCLVYGDDNVINISPEAIQYFNQQTITTAMKELGYKYTLETKDDREIPVSRDLSEVEFLKREFRWDAYQHRYLAPLDLSVILEMPYWYHDTINPRSIMIENVETALKELSFHEQSTFDEWAPRIAAASSKLIEHMPPIMSYRTLQRVHMAEPETF